ncbi:MULTISPECIES: ribonuclease [unclassified Mannheimia]|uniref:ribonuclease T2 family protein n=1 Tax=unclassified Mannheimia TaxID=2645054 RepID=UPI00359EDEA7
MNQKKLVSLIVLVVLAVISYFFNDSGKKEQPKPTTKQTQIQQNTQSSSALGNYDVQMKNDRLKQNIVDTDYYTLALSWSPAFCQKQRRNNNGKIPQHLKYQCDGEQTFGWVIHGLWPQSRNARRIEDHPRYCEGDLPMLPEVTIRKYLPESPGAKLLQGEWEKHGACAFNQAEDYFAKQKSLFNDLILPDVDMSKSELFKWVRENNPQLKGIYLGGGKDELYICYDKSWQPMDCPH